MRRKKRQLVSEDFLLETATGNRENRILEKSLLGTTFCSCAVPPNSVRPTAALYTRLFTDPLESDASDTWSEERCKRRLLRDAFRAVSRDWGIRKGGVYRP